MITLAVSDEFFTAYSKLPSKIQRAVKEFTKKFRKNPKAPGAHYEPINAVREPRLRSVRVTQGYRAIVLAPQTGDVFVLLWVANHDEAYRWAKDKRIEVNPTTGSLQLFGAATQIDLPELSPTQVAPTETLSGRFEKFSDDELYQAGIPKALLPSVRAVHTDADLDGITAFLPREAAEVLTGLACGMTLDNAIEEALAQPLVDVGTVDVDNVAAALARPQSGRQFKVLDDEFDFESVLDSSLEKWRVFLHPAQRKLVNRNYKGPTRVLGAAGTGKTVVAMHRAVWIAKNCLSGSDKLLFTTYTVNLASDIEKNLKSMLPQELMDRVEVVGVDALATRILRDKLRQKVRIASNDDIDRTWKEAIRAENTGPWNREFFKVEWRDVIHAKSIQSEEEYVKARRTGRGEKLTRSQRRKVWKVFEAYQEILAERGIIERAEILRRARVAVENKDTLLCYPSIIVDETQDMSAEALRLLRALAGEEHENDMFLAGDAHQRIYGRPVTMSSCGINIRGGRSKRLRINYRTTDVIRRYAMNVLAGETFDDLDGGTDDAKGYVSLRSGVAPEQHHFSSPFEEADFIAKTVKLLQKDKIPLEHICITGRTRGFLTSQIDDALSQAGIPSELLGRDAPTTQAVRLATMHRVKGLEFPIVIIAGIHEGLVPFPSPALNSNDIAVSRQAMKQERCLFYVSATRARDRLIVTGHGSRSVFLSG